MDAINLEKEIERARIANWIKFVAKTADKICEERAQDPSLMIDILNGEIYLQAQEKFAELKQQGFFDKQNLPLECNL